ncbi:MAG: hypothetical protein OXE02_08205 [Chloroflexi bacterium]|nr:hypothetical protein [Chloroflexota bacterium]
MKTYIIKVRGSEERKVSAENYTTDALGNVEFTDLNGDRIGTFYNVEWCVEERPTDP